MLHRSHTLQGEYLGDEYGSQSPIGARSKIRGAFSSSEVGGKRRR
jgi:hypothetical protein